MAALGLLLLQAFAPAVFAFTARAAAPSTIERLLPALDDGSHLDLCAPGRRVGDSVWPAAGSLCEFVDRNPELLRGKSVLELGSGTGAVGIFAAAACGASHVELTDGAQLLGLAKGNVHINRERLRCDVVVNEFLLGDLFEPAAGFVDVVLAADVTYAAEAHQPLVDTLEELLSFGATAVLAHQHRRLTSVLEDHSSLRRFVRLAERRGLLVESRHVDRANPLAPVEILQIRAHPDAQLRALLDEEAFD